MVSTKFSVMPLIRLTELHLELNRTSKDFIKNHTQGFYMLWKR